MRVVRVETEGLRGLRDGSFDFAASPRAAGHVTVVTGPPQAGLTTLLEAVALSAARLAPDVAATDPADVVRAGRSTAAIRTTWWLDTDERVFGGVDEETTDAEVIFRRGGLGRVVADPALLGVMSRYDHSPSLAKVVSIPVRRVTDGGFPPLGDFETDLRSRRLSSEPGKFVGLAHALIKHATGLGDRARFEGVQRLFGELCTSAQLTGIAASGHLEFALSSGVRVPLHHLSFGERNAFVLAAVPVLLGLGRSVVLLDTPELGLAPGLAAHWIRVLSGTMPGAQWILASRDPAVVTGVEASARIELLPIPEPVEARLTVHTYCADDCTITLPAGFRDRTVNALDWPLEGGDVVALVVQRERLHAPEGEEAPRPGIFERFVADQTRDQPTRFAGFHLDSEEAAVSDTGIEVRRRAFRWLYEQEVLYHHQAFVLAGFTVLVFTCSAKARHRAAVDRLLQEALADLRFRGA